MAVDPKLNNAAVLAQRAYNNAVTSLAAAQKTIATITAAGRTPTAAQTAALTAAQNAVTTTSTAVKSAQMALNSANNSVAVAAGTTGKAVSPAVDSGVKQAKPYNVQTATGTGPTLSSSNGLLDIAGATALALAAANPVGTARLVGSLFSSAKDILGVGGTTSSTTAPPAASNIGESVFDPGPPIQESVFDPRQDVGENVFDPGETYNGPATEESVFDPRQDIGENVFDPGETYNGPATEESVFDPRQDIGENVFDPGETYNGPATEESVFDPRQDIGENVFDPAAALPNPSLISPAPVNDPYAGLTSDQIRLLGGADPTDPYIRARLGIPQLTDSPLAANASFGTIKTGVPILDTAISSLGSLFGFNNTKTGTTTGSPAPTPDTAATAQAAAAVRVQDPALTDDEDQNLQNIVGAQGEIVRAEENIQSNNRQILANEEAQAAAQEQQRQAQAIIDQNNAELADDNLPDDRRAELEANNAAQRASIAENAAIIDEAQNNIDEATANNEQQTDSILTNQGVIGENAEAFSANGSELGAPVVADNDPQTAVDQNFLDANAEVQAETTLTILSEEETNALFDGAEPGLVNNFVEVDATATELTEEETAALFDGAEAAVEPQESVFDPENVDPNSDPFEQARFEAELAAEVPESEIVLTADEQAAADDPFEQRRLELEQEANREQLAMEATDVEPGVFAGQSDEFGGVDEAVAIEQADIDTRNDPALSEEEIQAELDRAVENNAAEDVETGIDPGENVFDPGETINAGDESVFNPDAVNSETDPSLPSGLSDAEILARQNPGGLSDEEILARQEAAAKQRAQEQATLQARYKQPASSDWRVRLQLAPNADYLYKDRTGSTILAPLYETDGVIFPYTPSIETTYNANYEMYDLTHSNFRGYFYKNSRVNDINIRATFTAQDTQEANYLLAVIHFFRSVTKMFYGAKDALRGAPPPLTYLSGLGQYQFNQHPCVVSQFNYSLPNDVDYIRAGAPNNYGTNLLTQRARTGAIAPEAGDPSGTRRVNSGLSLGGLPQTPSPSMINQNVNNLAQATYVPTKIEISLTLLPINTRSQVSTQFNMKDFASGALIKGGFW